MEISDKRHQSLAIAESRYEIVNVEPLTDQGIPEISIEVFDSTPENGSDTIACRVIVTASDGSHPDGGQQGVYADGRFFCDGEFKVEVPPGPTEVLIQKGPSYVPLQIQLDASLGKRVSMRVWLHKWFSPQELGWYGGDNHVHSQHDETAALKTGLAYTALQGRANGLDYITEAGSNVSYDGMDELSSDTFLLQHADEVKSVSYTGHLNTPGVTEPLDPDDGHNHARPPLFTQSITKLAHDQGAAVIYTHPLTPPHQIHWMGATGVFSDGVVRCCADLFDIDSKVTELLWFSILNLGNRVGCSSYTDSTLERLHTLTPGDRRVYCHSGALDYASIVKALRLGRTFATNGGPLFAFFTIDDAVLGDTLWVNPNQKHTCSIDIRSLYPLKYAQLFRRGNVVTSYDVTGSSGALSLAHKFEEHGSSWYVLRVEDERGNWCVTSPIYFETNDPTTPDSASAILFEISNHTRYVYLEPRFFAHVIVTVSPEDPILEVRLLKNGHVHHCFQPKMGNHVPSGHTPVTARWIEDQLYELAWLWHPNENHSYHFQLDYPITETGWFAIQVRRMSSITLTSDAIWFDKEVPFSRALSVAHLQGRETTFDLWGYGEEMLLSETEKVRADRWWYPLNATWRVVAMFDGTRHSLSGDAPYQTSRVSGSINPRLHDLFRSRH